MSMQSTGQGGRHSAQPVHSAGSTVCIRFGPPAIASTGQASMHSVQPMHQASSTRATASGAWLAVRGVERDDRAPGEPRQRGDRRRRRRAGSG